MSRNLVELVESYRQVVSQFGPFRFGVNVSEVEKSNPELVWTLAEFEDTEFGRTVLISGRRDEYHVFDYALASKPYASSESMKVISEVVWFLCEKCGAGEISDPDKCLECKGNGTVYIDVEELANADVELSESSIWARRQAD
jgi:hypothetical protein